VTPQTPPEKPVRAPSIADIDSDLTPGQTIEDYRLARTATPARARSWSGRMMNLFLRSLLR
jgi:hypothetical protein